MTNPRSVTILGSTGSIGTQALDVIERNRSRFRVLALAAGGAQPQLLAKQVLQVHPEAVALSDPGTAAELRHYVSEEADNHKEPVPDFELLVGDTAAAEVAGRESFGGSRVDVVLNGITGSIGLPATLSALQAGHTLALANKESLVVGGPLVQRAIKREGQIVPVDSEHSAIAQCLRGGQPDEVARLVLTASGGPFRGYSRADLEKVTAQAALAHPTWNMGPVVTINSATLVNKGLEVIEAHLLFGIPMDRIDVVVHPQSVVHSMVEFVDGSTIAQASPPDMRLPIAVGLAWPGRVPHAAFGCDWTRATSWTFEPVDNELFPALDLARHVGGHGGVLPAVFNAANEECVAVFLARKIRFVDIVKTVAAVVALAEHDVFSSSSASSLTLEDVLSAEQWARMRAREILGKVS